MIIIDGRPDRRYASVCGRVLPQTLCGYPATPPRTRTISVGGFRLLLAGAPRRLGASRHRENGHYGVGKAFRIQNGTGTPDRAQEGKGSVNIYMRQASAPVAHRRRQNRSNTAPPRTLGSRLSREDRALTVPAEKQNMEQEVAPCWLDRSRHSLGNPFPGGASTQPATQGVLFSQDHGTPALAQMTVMVSTAFKRRSLETAVRCTYAARLQTLQNTCVVARATLKLRPSLSGIRR